MDKTTNNPSDHELNAVLARVAGVAIHGDKVKNKWWCHGNLGGWAAWNPLHDANQMERVEEALRRSLCGWSIEVLGSHYLAKVWNKHPQMGSQNVWEVEHKDKKRAFALAVYAMEQSQKGTT